MDQKSQPDPNPQDEREPSGGEVAWSARDWSLFLTQELGYPVDVVYSRARRQVVESRWRGSTAHVRLSSIFANAPESVRADFARWMKVGRRARKACERLDTWIEAAVQEMAPARKTRLRTAGAVHDLAQLAESLHVGEFHGETSLAPRPAVTWGRRSGARAVHSLRLGSYTAPERLVRVHPILDQEQVPDWFVRYILFHEFLHAVKPPRPTSAGRLLRHPPEFREREKQYVDYARALQWQEKHLGELLASARSGRSMPARSTKKPQPRTAARLLQQLRLWPDRS